MFLEENTLFDNRYKLLRLLGQGASAQVWLAADTLSGNLQVAVKIFVSQDELDSYGQRDFRNEFVTVYNINHQNLLTPTNYSVCDGTPYLVLPFCENGSITAMTGRCEEEDVIKILHDVAAGLDYLHLHNVIHQDIKPDNILIDDDLNFLVTDFGIAGSREVANEAVGGTRAYMAPERFRGVSNAKGDIWALGASAYEMITGYPPYGDHGGLVQSPSAPIPPIEDKKWSSSLLKLIYAMLDPNPDKRPSADFIRRVTEHRLDSGSWRTSPNAKKVAHISLYVCIAAAIIAGLIFWGYSREKTYYYRDYYDTIDGPKGIGRLSAKEQQQRDISYRITSRSGHVTRLSVVDRNGDVRGYGAYDIMGIRFPDQEYKYNDKGELDYMIARNADNEILYTFDYINDSIVEIKWAEGSKSKCFTGTDDNFISLDYYSGITSIASITKLKLSFDDEERLSQVVYYNSDSQMTPDTHGTCGISFSYNNDNQITCIANIDRNGDPANNTLGMAFTTCDYDENYNRTFIKFETADHNPSWGNANIYHAEYEYDEVGNLIEERYYDENDNPISGLKSGNYGYHYTYHSDGDITTERLDSLFDKHDYVDNESKPRISYDCDNLNRPTHIEFDTPRQIDGLGTVNSIDITYNNIGSVLTYHGDNLVFDEETRQRYLNVNKFIRKKGDREYQTVTIEHDDNGRIMCKKVSKADVTISEANYTYDDNSCQLRTVKGDPDWYNLLSPYGSASETITISYNHRGQPTKLETARGYLELRYAPNGSPLNDGRGFWHPKAGAPASPVDYSPVDRPAQRSISPAVTPTQSPRRPSPPAYNPYDDL